MAYIKYSRQFRKKIDSSLFWTVTKDISDSNDILEKGTDIYCRNISINHYNRHTGTCRISVGDVYFEISEHKFDSCFSPNQSLSEDYISYEKKLAKRTKLSETTYALLWVWSICFLVVLILGRACSIPHYLLRFMIVLISLLWFTSLIIWSITISKIIPKYEKTLTDMKSIHNN